VGQRAVGVRGQADGDPPGGQLRVPGRGEGAREVDPADLLGSRDVLRDAAERVLADLPVVVAVGPLQRDALLAERLPETAVGLGHG